MLAAALALVALAAPAASLPPRYMVVPGSSGFLVDAFRGGVDAAEFPPPEHRENRGHVGTWLARAPRHFEASGGRKVVPRFHRNATLVAAQRDFRIRQRLAPLPPTDVRPPSAQPLKIPDDYAFYNQARYPGRSPKALRLEMACDAILDTTEPLLIVATSEGGAIVQKCMESDEIAAHMRAQGHRVALVSPAYAVGNASIALDPFYRAARLGQRQWWVDQELVYSRGVPMHVMNTDIGFAGMQNMARNGTAEAGQFDAMLRAGRSDPQAATITWDYWPGAPHSLPACDVVRPAAEDRGGYVDPRSGAWVPPFSRSDDGIPLGGFCSGAHSAEATRTLSWLFDEMARRPGAPWSASAAAEAGAWASRNAGGVATADDVMRQARTAERAAAQAWAAARRPAGQPDPGVRADVVAARADARRAGRAEQARCLREVEAEREAQRSIERVGASFAAARSWQASREKGRSGTSAPQHL
jgi:hypothetical protein